MQILLYYINLTLSMERYKIREKHCYKVVHNTFDNIVEG